MQKIRRASPSYWSVEFRDILHFSPPQQCTDLPINTCKASLNTKDRRSCAIKLANLARTVGGLKCKILIAELRDR